MNPQQNQLLSQAAAQSNTTPKQVKQSAWQQFRTFVREHLPHFHHAWHVKFDFHLFRYIFVGLLLVAVLVGIIGLANMSNSSQMAHKSRASYGPNINVVQNGGEWEVKIEGLDSGENKKYIGYYVDLCNSEDIIIDPSRMNFVFGNEDKLQSHGEVIGDRRDIVARIVKDKGLSIFSGEVLFKVQGEKPQIQEAFVYEATLDKDGLSQLLGFQEVGLEIGEGAGCSGDAPAQPTASATQVPQQNPQTPQVEQSCSLVEGYPLPGLGAEWDAAHDWKLQCNSIDVCGADKGSYDSKENRVACCQAILGADTNCEEMVTSSVATDPQEPIALYNNFVCSGQIQAQDGSIHDACYMLDPLVGTDKQPQQSVPQGGEVDPVSGGMKCPAGLGQAYPEGDKCICTNNIDRWEELIGVSPEQCNTQTVGNAGGQESQPVRTAGGQDTDTGSAGAQCPAGLGNAYPDGDKCICTNNLDQWVELPGVPSDQCNDQTVGNPGGQESGGSQPAQEQPQQQADEGRERDSGRSYAEECPQDSKQVVCTNDNASSVCDKEWCGNGGIGGCCYPR